MKNEDRAGSGNQVQQASSVAATAACGHTWDGSLHRACPRCAIAGTEAVLEKMYRLFEEIHSQSWANTTIAALAQEGMDLLLKPRERLAED